ncbi:DUF6503 family protein [Tamlana flava]|uniref:DUF6503 family protein n=1 Tax=Tamlana flava TaxID=3158572 RepID=UPI00351BDE10
MKKNLLLIFILYAPLLFSQELTGTQLLKKAIQYHDPIGKWKTFNGELFITMEIPEKQNRDSHIIINLPKQYFSIKSTVEDKVTRYIIEKDSVSIIFNEESKLSNKTLEENRLSKSRAKLLQNYYTYLYGLPMKLNDPGTIIQEKIESKSFRGKNYWVLKASYKKEIGNDTWYFYFNKDNYAMEVYQFFHDESKNDGEYILLSDEELVNSIKMPKIRAWYKNSDDTYLGTDILKSSKQ